VLGRTSIPSLRDPRTRRIAITAGILVVVVWAVALTYVALRGTTRSTRSTTTRTAPPLSARPAPSHDDPHALWLFGFDTLRLDPAHPTRVGHLGYAAFGDVAGAPGRVILYDATTGRFGVLDAETNRIVDNTTIGSRDVDRDVRPLLAPLGDAAWLVTAPGSITRHALTSGSSDRTVALPVPVADAGARAVGTRVAAAGSTVWAVVDVVVAAGRRDVVAYALDAGTERIVTTRSLGDVDVVTVVALPGRAAVVTRNHVIVVPVSANVPPTASPGVPVALHDGVGVDGAVWLLDDAAQLTRLDPATATLARPIPLPASARPVGAGSRVVATGSTLWALLTGPPGQPFHAVLASLDAHSGRSAFALGLPDDLAIAALAAT